MPLTMTRGDYAEFEGTVTRNGSPVNLTGATFKFTARRWLNDSNYVFQVTTESGDITVSDPTSGVVLIGVPEEKTSSLLDTVVLHCDLEMTESNGRVTTLQKDKLTVEADVS